MIDQERRLGEALMSQKAYAEARGWSKQYVNQLVKKGRIVLVDGQIDPQQADRVLGQTKDPSRSSAFRTDSNEALGSTMQGSDGDAARVHSSFARARTVREHYRALRERLDYEEAAGNLVSRRDVEDDYFTIARMTRDRLLQGMSDVASTVAPKLGVEESALRALLLEQAVELLNTIASDIHDPEGEADVGAKDDGDAP